MNTFDKSRISVTDNQSQHLSSFRKNQKSNDLLIQNLHNEQEKRENLKNLLREIYEKEKIRPPDSGDSSLQPSYSKFQLPYFIKCRNRYKAKKDLYEQRFQYEIEQLIAQQATGYEAARLNRHLCITTIWPPLHSLSEINHTQRYFFSLTRKERKRLNWIMNTNII